MYKYIIILLGALACLGAGLPNDPYFSGTNRLVQHDLQPQYWRNDYQWYFYNSGENSHVYNFDWTIYYSQFDEADGTNDMQALLAWTIESSATNVLIGTIDFGVNTNHIELLGRINLEKSWTIQSNGNFSDLDGHGTKGIGAVGAIGNNNFGICGMLKDGANIAILKVTSRTMSQFIEAVKAGLNNKCRVIYFSDGLPGPGNNNTNLYNLLIGATNTMFISPVFNDSIDYNHTNNPFGVLDYPITWKLPNVISVANIRKSGDLYSSGYGSNYIDLAAQGRIIITLSYTNNTNLAYSSGTSMAAYHVWGGTALMIEHWPDAYIFRIRQKMLESVDKNYSLDLRSQGTFNLYKSLKSEGLVGLNPTQMLVNGPEWKTYGLFWASNVDSPKEFVQYVNGTTILSTTNLGFYFVTNAIDLGFTKQQKERMMVMGYSPTNSNTNNGLPTLP